MNRMKVATTALAVMMAPVAQAQTVATTQASVGGATGDATYSVRLIGADGVSYNCRPDTTTVNGAVARLCRRATAGGGTAGGDAALTGGTVTAGAGIAAGIVVVALVAGSDDSATSSTTTTGSD
ncbi:MAG: hypothetical protein AAFU63_02345 [Pseudomonadota bacterium]